MRALVTDNSPLNIVRVQFRFHHIQILSNLQIPPVLPDILGPSLGHVDVTSQLVGSVVRLLREAHLGGKRLNLLCLTCYIHLPLSHSSRVTPAKPENIMRIRLTTSIYHRQETSFNINLMETHFPATDKGSHPVCRISLQQSWRKLSSFKAVLSLVRGEVLIFKKIGTLISIDVLKVSIDVQISVLCSFSDINRVLNKSVYIS